MYSAAIVDDDAAIRAYIQREVIASCNKEGIRLSFDSFDSGQGFLDMLSQHFHFDVVFMDIEMPEIDGIEVSRQIRGISPDTIIIFISSREELVYDTFEVKPFRFIPKNRMSDFLPQVVAALKKELALSEKNEFKFTDASGDIYSFSLNKIIYVEASNKDCRIVTKEGESIIRIRLMELEALLPGDIFIKPHRSFLVNVSYIFFIGKTSITLTTKEEIPMSRNRVTDIKNAFLSYANR